MGAAPGFAATLQANEAITSILGIGNRVTNRLFVFNLLDNSFDSLDIAGLEPCPVCLNPDTPLYRTLYDAASCRNKPAQTATP
jgi:molybdopterin/thiamine biosynthesis adenylyltransferase